MATADAPQLRSACLSNRRTTIRARNMKTLLKCNMQVYGGLAVQWICLSPSVSDAGARAPGQRVWQRPVEMRSEFVFDPHVLKLVMQPRNYFSGTQPTDAGCKIIWTMFCWLTLRLMVHRTSSPSMPPLHAAGGIFSSSALLNALQNFAASCFRQVLPGPAKVAASCVHHEVGQICAIPPTYRHIWCKYKMGVHIRQCNGAAFMHV